MPSLGDLPDPGIEPRSPALQMDSLLSESPGKPVVRSQKLNKLAVNEANRSYRSFFRGKNSKANN